MREIPTQFDLTTLEYKKSEFTYAPVLTVKVIPSPLQEPERVAFNWSIKSFTPKSMII